MAGNPTMLIWLGKQELGQSEKIEQYSRTESVEEYLKRIATEENN
jgi:hypothetical protein